MPFDIKKLKDIENLTLTEENIQKIRNDIGKKIPEEWVQDFLVAAQNIIDAENQREELAKNFMAIAKIILMIAL